MELRFNINGKEIDLPEDGKDVVMFINSNNELLPFNPKYPAGFSVPRILNEWIHPHIKN